MDKARRAEQQRRYQRKRKVERHEAYLRRRAVGYYHDTCPDCRGAKSAAAMRCLDCSRKSQAIKPRPAPDPLRFTRCPYCDSELRALEWHGRKFMRCPGCGLETTRGELRRIAFEAVLEVAA